MSTPQKRRSRYEAQEDAPQPAAPVGAAPWAAGDAAEAKRLLESARADLERVVSGELRRLEATLGAKAQRVAARLLETRAQIERYEKDTAAMRAHGYDDLLKQLREKMNALG